MNETRHYFGAYLEIKVRPSKKKTTVSRCENWHRENGKYCSKCGSEIITETVISEHMPNHITDLIEEDDRLAVITPPSLFETGIIIAIGNLAIITNDTWMHISRYDNDEEIKAFPTNDEVETMKIAFIDGYHEVIDEIRKSRLVISAEVKSGYVLDCEY